MTSTTTAPEAATPAPVQRWRPEGMKTRQPTGKRSWPLILIEGEEYSGKTYAAAKLSGSDKIGDAFFLDLGEGHSDEYSRVPGARYEILEHDGTFSSIYRQIDFVRQVAEHAVAHGLPPVLLIIDSMASMWRLLSMWVNQRARNSRANRAILAQDPDAEIDPGRNYWNDANDRHANLVSLLRRIPGIVVMTGRGKWVSGTDAKGQPTKEKEYTLETQKGLGYATNVWLRVSRTAKPLVVGMRCPDDDSRSIRPGVDEAVPIDKKDWDLEWVIFDLWGLDPAQAATPNLIMPRPDRTPEQIRDEALRSSTTWERLRELYEEARAFHGLLIRNEHQVEESLGELINRVAQARVVSDPDVVARVALDIAAASSPEALKSIGQAMVAAISQGKVSAKDRMELRNEYEARMRELRAAEREAARAQREQPADGAAGPDQEAGT